jgi:hypothetical protein
MDEAGAISNTELADEARDVTPNSDRSDTENVGNRCCRMSSTDHPENLRLTTGQSSALPTGSAQLQQQVRDQRPREHRLPRVNRVEDRVQPLWADPAGKVTNRAGVNSLEHLVRVTAVRHDYDR